ncbi:MAG: hypothetical protein KIT73_02280 [Burkholderiales bacterium]|nr:hypothetical protein [Burkholderiales bacterium]
MKLYAARGASLLFQGTHLETGEAFKRALNSPTGSATPNTGCGHVGHLLGLCRI